MRRAVVVGLALCLSACFSSPTAPVVASGTYTLLTVNGGSLPFTFPNGIAITSESMILSPNGTFTDVATRADGSVATDLGTYNVIGANINFGDQTINLLYAGQLSGNILTTQVGTYTERWQKN